MTTKSKQPTGFVHYQPPALPEVTDEPVDISDIAMEELIEAEEKKKHRPDDNSAFMWS